MIAQIEQAITNRIAGAGFAWLRAVQSRGGRTDAGVPGVGFPGAGFPGAGEAETAPVFPCVWVGLKEEDAPQPVGAARDIWHVPATFQVMFGEQAPSGEATVMYHMLADVRRLLLQQDFGLPIDQLRPGRTTPLVSEALSGSGVSVYVQEWHTRYPITTRVEEETPLLRVGLSYVLRPQEEVSDVGDDLVTLR